MWQSEHFSAVGDQQGLAGAEVPFGNFLSIEIYLSVTLNDFQELVPGPTTSQMLMVS